MIKPCCPIIITLLIAIFGLQIYSVILHRRPVPAVRSIADIQQSPTVVPTLQPTLPVSTSTPAADAEKLLVEVNNIAACGFTDQAEFTLDKDYLITRFRTWYSWASNETEVAYRLLKSNQEIATGKLVRKECDPYQRQWCIAADFEFNRNLSAGDYVLKLDSAKICQNSGSNGKGFIYVWGR